MIHGTEGPTTAALAQESSDDTVELELTREQGLALARAAEMVPAVVRADEARPLLAVPAYENFASRRTARVDFVCNVTFAVAVIGVAAAFMWPTPARHPPLAPAVARTAPPPAAVVRPVAAEPQGPPVRVTNAFDPKEVFEFPQGTTDADAREAVAELLLSRARERAQRPAPKLASNLQPDHGAAVQQPEVFVTRLARAKEPLNGTN